VAASFSEMERRLVPERASYGFLRAADDRFASAMRELSPAVRAADPDLFARVTDASKDLNIAGLCNPGNRNWYPVDLEDTVRGAAKLGLTPDHVRGALAQFVVAAGL